MILVLAFLGSMVPAVLLFLWLRGQKNMAPDYRERCGKSLLYGLISVVAVLFVSLIATLSLTACGTFKCQICEQEKSGSKHEVSMLGQTLTVCDDCYEGMQILNGLFN